MEDIILIESAGNIEHFTDIENVEIREEIEEELPADQEYQMVDNRLVDEGTSPDSLSGEAVSDLKKEIEELKNELNKKSFTDVSVSAGNDIDLYNRNESLNTISSNIVSQNIIDTPLNEYSLSDSLTVLLIVMFFTFGMITIIKRSIFKWS